MRSTVGVITVSAALVCGWLAWSSGGDARAGEPEPPVVLPADLQAWAAEAFGAGDVQPKLTDKTPLPPFSFTYDGQASASFLRTWQQAGTCREEASQFAYVVSWTDPKTGLKVTANATTFKDFPAVEWLLHLENTGQQDTPILEQVQVLDQLVAAAGQRLVLDQIRGDDCTENSFLPLERTVNPGETVRLAPVGGRSSNGTFPFFNLDRDGQGLMVAIGWTGQWAAEIQRDQAGATRLRAGMELTRLRLHPGEAIRTPRIMLLGWKGDRLEAHNQFRRLLLRHYLPQLDGQPIELAISAQSFNRTGGRGYWASEPGQLAAVEVNRQLGCNSLWLDAGWFEGDFPNGVGNWLPKPQEFPRGLRPVGNACQQAGLKFLVWYEPERVAANTRLAQEQSGFILPLQKGPGVGGLFNLGDPQARRWLTDLLVRQIAEFNIHTYRNDFNIDPLPFWRANDPPERQGITEIRYVEGLYALWDDLRAKYPRMYLDDCASGGRRIDLEMLRRGVVQTRSDTACVAGRSEWDQCQACGLNLYLPLHATIGWDVGAYECRSSATSGFCGEWDILHKEFPRDAARASICEIQANRQYWLGDFYPLTPTTLAGDVWMAWQLHRPDLDAGIVLAFRRKDCPQATLAVKLRGLTAEQRYVVTWSDELRHETTQTMLGRELADTPLSLSRPRSSLLVRYAPVR